MVSFATLRAHKIRDFEQLRSAVPGTRRDIVQIAPGQLRGELVHASISDLPIDAVTFDIELRSRGGDGPLPSALKIVRRVEDYLAASGTRAVHISEICTQLHLTRRTLHRAFHEAVGIGPITFLRYLRLCAVHTALRSGLSADETIANLAIAHGFLNVGRFAQYYRQVFGENPSDTRRKGDIASATQGSAPASPAR
jgi:AraC-like DNA-binding protein